MGQINRKPFKWLLYFKGDIQLNSFREFINSFQKAWTIFYNSLPDGLLIGVRITRGLWTNKTHRELNIYKPQGELKYNNVDHNYIITSFNVPYNFLLN